MTILIALTGLAAYFLIKKNKTNEEENPAVAEYCKVKSGYPKSVSK